MLVFTLVFLHHQCQLHSGRWGWGWGGVRGKSSWGVGGGGREVMEREKREEVKGEQLKNVDKNVRKVAKEPRRATFEGLFFLVHCLKIPFPS